MALVKSAVRGSAWNPAETKENMMKVKDVMTPDCIYVSPDTTISEAAEIMKDQDIGFIPIAENDKLIGMVTDRDIVIRAVAKKASPETDVKSIMSPHTYYCFDDQDAEEACANMADIKVRRLPVVNRDKRLVGVVSLGDIAQDVNKVEVGQTMQSITDPADTARAA
jgi:CBS domain-containing protein